MPGGPRGGPPHSPGPRGLPASPTRAAMAGSAGLAQDVTASTSVLQGRAGAPNPRGATGQARAGKGLVLIGKTQIRVTRHRAGEN